MSIRLPTAERRDSIVAAAVPLFARKGFAGTTTREIAEAAGVSEALVFKHFATKTALYDAILESCEDADPEFDRLMQLPASTGTLIEIVTSVTGHFADQSDENCRDQHRLFIRSLLEDGEFARVGLRAFENAVLPSFAASYEAARAAGDLSATAPSAPAAFWVVAQMQLMIGSLALVDAARETAVPLASHVQTMLRGIGLREDLIGRLPVLTPQFTAVAATAAAAE
jgi:AcrR family transcriptional regulator